MDKINFKKVSVLPSKPEKNTLYFVENGDYAEVYLTSSAGVYKKVGNSTMINEIAVLGGIPSGSIGLTELSSIVNTYLIHGETAYGWGDHSTFGYLTSFTETDPIFTAWDRSTGISILAAQVTDFDTEVSNNPSVVANTAKVSFPGFTSLLADYGFVDNSGNWDTAFGWGDHAGLYLSVGTQLAQSKPLIASQFLNSYDAVTGLFTSAQPLFSDIASTPTTLAGYGITNAYTQTEINEFFSGATPITGYNKTDWDTAFSWGDHSLVGYLTSFTETDPIFSASTVSNIIDGVGFLKNNGIGGWFYDSSTYLTSFDITTQTDPKYLRSDVTDTFEGDVLNLNGITVFNNDAILPAAFYSEDFSVDLGDFTTSGDAVWTRVTDEGNGDLFSARSGAITNNEISILTLSKTTTQEFTLCSFDYKTSTEENFDWLFVVLDGQLIDRFSGEIDWATRQFYIQGIGTHEIKFIYFRDHADDGGTNQCWIDNVSLYNYTIDAYSLGSFDIADDLYVSGNSVFKNKLTVGGEIVTNGEFHLFNPVTEIRAARIRSRASSNSFTLYNQTGGSAGALYSTATNNALEVFSITTPETLKIQFGNFNEVASLEMRGPTAKVRIGENLGSDPTKILVVNGHSLFRGVTSTGVYTVATLPTGAKGDRAFVSDATAATFASVVAGGGANNVPVYHDGTNWKIG